MDYAQLLGMTGGNSQSAGIMDTALGGGNVGAQLLGATPGQLPKATPARLPGADFRGFAPTSSVPSLLAKYPTSALRPSPGYQWPYQNIYPPAPVAAPVAAPVPKVDQLRQQFGLLTGPAQNPMAFEVPTDFRLG